MNLWDYHNVAKQALSQMNNHTYTILYSTAPNSNWSCAGARRMEHTHAGGLVLFSPLRKTTVQVEELVSNTEAVKKQVELSILQYRAPFGIATRKTDNWIAITTSSGIELIGSNRDIFEHQLHDVVGIVTNGGKADSDIVGFWCIGIELFTTNPHAIDNNSKIDEQRSPDAKPSGILFL